MDKSKTEPSEYQLGGAVFVMLIVICGVVIAIVAPREPPKPRPPLVIKPPSARKVGEAIGKTSGRFTRGFFSGLWNSGEQSSTILNSPSDKGEKK